MKKRLLISLLLGGTAVLAAGPAVSAKLPDFCQSSRVCIYDDNDFKAILGARGPGLGLRTVSADANDKTDSWKNRTSRSAAWYYDKGGKGKCTTMGPVSSEDNLGWQPSDELSSWRTNRGCRPS